MLGFIPLALDVKVRPETAPAVRLVAVPVSPVPAPEKDVAVMFDAIRFSYPVPGLFKIAILPLLSIPI